MHDQLTLPLDGAAAAKVVRLPTGARARIGSGPARTSGNGPRLGELLGALSLALDMAEGQPAGHSQRSCWIGQMIGRALGLSAMELRELYYATLLKDVGGSSNAARVCQLFLGDDRSFKHERRIAGASLAGAIRFVVFHTRPKAGLLDRLRAILNVVQNGCEIGRELADARCTRGAQFARQLRFSEAVADGISCLEEHWDGSGDPERLAGAEIPLYSRIAQLAQVVDTLHTRAGPQSTREEVARRSGRLLDPKLCEVFDVLSRDPGFWAALGADDLEHRLFEMEPARELQPLDDHYLDDIAMAFGQVADAKSPYTNGHSTRVALIAEHVSRALGLVEDQRRWLRRGALLHDLGKLGISNTILDKPGELDPWEWAQVHRHPACTEQILSRISSFGALARVAGAHHERLDGSGYPRGLDARHIRLESRIITTADVFESLTAERPWRAALPTSQALAIMQESVGSALDAECFEALQQALANVDARLT